MNRAARVLAAGFLLVVSALVAVGTAPPAARADSVRSGQWYLSTLHVAEAQRLTKGQGVVVAVVDTGVDPTHRDIAGSVLPGIDIYTGKAPVRGKYFTDYHGTAMAGLIAGHGHGAGGRDGILGIAPGAKILPIKVSRSTGLSGGREVAIGIEWAVKLGADVISVSLQTPSDDRLRESVRAAWDKGIPVVAATGNDGPSSMIFYDGALPVTAIGPDGKFEDSLQWMAEPKGVAGPGGDVPSAIEGGYETSTGTSNCTAIVAGVMALIKAKYPSDDTAGLFRRIRWTADDRGEPGQDGQYGYGVVNPVAALTKNVTASPSATPATTAAAEKESKSTSDVPAAVVVAGVGCLAVLLLGAIVGGFVFVARKV
ncbi:S8 family serine peptidase [Cryptosporangium sp. NPDC051539]|uniref:S8 family serine peptidase n=1 Tax=Cryptosporangium sp. NPDC051539 TaxID=3363962 RepID=UPI003797F6DF